MHKLLIPLFLTSALLLAGCTSNAPPATPTSTTPASTGATPTTSRLHADLLGDGSTFVAPIMDKWRVAFQQGNGGVTLSYTGGGSGKGRTDITKSLVDFAGSDAPMKDSEIANATDILHIPVAAGGVAVAYNVPEVAKTPIKFDGDTLAKVFLGKITKWNDPALVALNPGVTLPAQDIQIVHRSDGSGTTATFTDYLAKVSADWKSGPGAGSTVNWPVGTGANGNNGVGSQVQQIPYTLGYVGAEWGNISAIQTGVVKNAMGNFEPPTPAAVSAALDAGSKAGAFDERLRGSVTNTNAPDAYPIAAVTWVLVHQHQTDAAKGAALAAFLWYMLHDGQAVNGPNNYAPIPASLISKAEPLVNSMDANGQKLG